jgi:hypothetical protein
MHQEMRGSIVNVNAINEVKIRKSVKAKTSDLL